jgi:hypothetical protein
LSFGVNEGKEIHVEINVNKEGDFFCSKKKTVAKKSATKKKTDSQKTTRKVSKKRSPVRKKPSKDS